MTERSKWDERYNASHLINGTAPSDFLASVAGYLPQCGTAFDLAGGEGRNSIFLAERGLEVVAIDISMRALEKCLRIARERGVSVDAAAADLTQFVIPGNSLDVIVNFNYLERSLAAMIIDGLKPGGLLVFETLTEDHLKWKPDFNPQFLLKRGELLGVFRGLHLLKYRETDLVSPTSARSVASLLAKKDR
jgi:SAM-dependent methyltransferase